MNIDFFDKHSIIIDKRSIIMDERLIIMDKRAIIIDKRSIIIRNRYKSTVDDWKIAGKVSDKRIQLFDNRR